MENYLNTVLFLFHCRHAPAAVCLSQGAMPEMEKESIIDSENGPQSPTVAHQTTDMIGQEQIGSSLPEMNHTEDSDSQKNMSVEGNNQKVERFLTPSPVSRSYEGQGTETDDDEEEEEARSRTTEDFQTEWNRESSVRPQTAPLMDIIASGRQSERDSSEMRTKSVPLSLITKPEQITLDQTQSAENDPQSDKTVAWHPHVYAKPPKQPTPHSISDILGLSRTRLDSGSNGGLYKEEISRHSFHRMGSSMSMSESSDSEEQFRGGEQPLDLCVAKSRSPVGKERPSKGKGE